MTDPTDAPAPERAAAPKTSADNDQVAIVGAVVVVLAGLVAAKLSIDSHTVEVLCGGAVTGLFAVINGNRGQ